MAISNLSRDAIIREASIWYCTHRAGELSNSERMEFLVWLKSSPVHIEEYFSIAIAARTLASDAQAIEDINALLAANDLPARDNVVPFAPERELPVEPPPRRRKVPRRLLAAAACLVLFTIGISAFVFRETLRFGPGETYTTVQGQQGSWRLADGSVLYLNSNSEVTLRFSERQRLAQVHYGQALFQVAHEAAREFHVLSGDAHIIAIGTQFDVYRTADSTRVTVLDGRVAVIKAEEAAKAQNPVQSAGVLRLTAGQQITVDRNSISEPLLVDTNQTSAWLQKRVVFEHQPLHLVVADFNRYSPVPLKIADMNLRDLRITGTFSVYDLESFLEFMRRVDGVVVEVTPDAILLRRQSLPARKEPATAGHP